MSTLKNCYEYFILQDSQNHFLFFGRLFNEVHVKWVQKRHLSQAMLSSLSSFIIFAQTDQTTSTWVFSFLDLRTDNQASFSKYFSTRWMSTISSSLTVSNISMQTGKMSPLVENRWPAMGSLTASDVHCTEREPSVNHALDLRSIQLFWIAWRLLIYIW